MMVSIAAGIAIGQLAQQLHRPERLPRFGLHQRLGHRLRKMLEQLGFEGGEKPGQDHEVADAANHLRGVSRLDEDFAAPFRSIRARPWPVRERPGRGVPAGLRRRRAKPRHVLAGHFPAAGKVLRADRAAEVSIGSVRP